MKRKFFAIIIFIIVAVAAFFGIQYFTKSGMFKVYGKLEIAENVPKDIKSKLTSISDGEDKIERDIAINMNYSLESPKKLNCDATLGCEANLLYDILVPVADFYNSNNAISANEVSAKANDHFEAYLTQRSTYDNSDDQKSTPFAPIISALGSSDTSVKFISVLNLGKDQKLLSFDYDGDYKYYLDTLESGAIFIYVNIPLVAKEGVESKLSRTANEDENKVIDLISPALKQFPTKDAVLSFAQTGVTALSRNMLSRLNQVGGDAAYFAENIKDFLSSKDLTHISNESSFTNYATSSNICADPRMIGAITTIGTDIVELTVNHNLDCGDEAAISTIDKYNELGMKIVGGGKNAEEAAKPLEINQKGTGLTFLAYNQSTGGATYDGTPGANQYYEEDAVTNINAAKERGDIVIVDIQYYECSAYVSTTEDTTCDYANSAAGDQVGFFRHLIDLGADIVVGTSAHQPQTYELYGNGAIYYGLGNLFFDQVWWPGTTRSLILTHYFWNGKLLNTRITPTVFDSKMQVKLMDEEGAEWFINRLNQVRP